jgi:hypothetical protein
MAEVAEVYVKDDKTANLFGSPESTTISSLLSLVFTPQLWSDLNSFHLFFNYG